MGREHYINDILTSGTYTDLDGETMTYFYGGENRLGADSDYADFSPASGGTQPYDADGTQRTLVADDETIADVPICDMCGLPVESVDDLVSYTTELTRKKLKVHTSCMDEKR